MQLSKIKIIFEIEFHIYSNSNKKIEIRISGIRNENIILKSEFSGLESKEIGNLVPIPTPS